MMPVLTVMILIPVLSGPTLYEINRWPPASQKMNRVAQTITTQQDKMKSCAEAWNAKSADAKSNRAAAKIDQNVNRNEKVLTREDYRKFMSECLVGRSSNTPERQ
jgi:hypothetical protein